MTNFRITRPSDFIDQVAFDGAIAGESLTRKPMSIPSERPPAFPDARDALDTIFESLTKRDNARKFLALLDAKIPLDALVAVVLRNMVLEGVTTPQAAIIIGPALTTMFVRMAESANIDFKLSSDDQTDTLTTEELLAADIKSKEIDTSKTIDAIEKSTDELSKLPTTDKGLLTKPEDIA